MTIEETIETLKMAMAEIEWNYPMEYVVALKTAIEILESRIKRKPKCYIERGNQFDYECPQCSMTYGCVTWHMKHCPNCGQALDWIN